MRPSTEAVIRQLDVIAAFLPHLKKVVEDMQETITGLDRMATRPEAPPRLPADLVVGFKVQVYPNGSDYSLRRTEKCVAIAEWLNSQAILTPEVAQAPNPTPFTDITDPRD